MRFLHEVLGLWLLASIANAEQGFRDDSSRFHDREILLSVFQSTGGFSWTDARNWFRQDADVCEWFGIQCYDESFGDSRRIGRIQAIILEDNHLVGTLPTEIFEIPYLETLNLDDNVDLVVDLSGIGKAQFLKELDLSNTAIGNIDGIGGASNLEILHMTGSRIRGPLPSDLFTLTNLAFIYANDNAFSGTLPSRIAQLTRLREIYLGNSDLTGQVPDSLGSMTLLEVLVLNNNAFGGTIPGDALNSLSSLKMLALQRDPNLPKGDGISGSVPAFDNHRQLTALYLNNQRLSGNLDSHFLMNSPEGSYIDVDLSSNQITGAVPGTLEDKRFLDLNLAGNRITSVPSNLRSSDNSCLAMNDWMAGEISALGCNAFLCPPGTYAPEGRRTVSDSCSPCSANTEIWGSTECSSSAPSAEKDRQVLVAFYNVMGGRGWRKDDNWMNLSGSICDWFGVSCTEGGLVRGLELSNNDLSGTVPSEIFSLSELQTLDLGFNKIEFNFQGISNARNLQALNLAGTNFLPEALNGIEELAQLDLLSFSIDANHIGGPIPAAVFEITSLQQLDLGNNGFVGSLDTRVGQLTQLRSLQISGNDLTGQLPGQIGNLENLRELLAAENRFEGSLPESLSALTNLQSLSLQQVVTAGGIGGPMPSFSNFSQLTSLKLASNRLTGNLPTDLLSSSSNLGGRIIVDVSDNMLQGQVPSEWSRFADLVINLAGNRITGIAPNLCSLDWMDGKVRDFGCDAILCPRGTSNRAGRRSDTTSTCVECSGGGTEFLGARTCSSQTVEFGTDHSSEASILSDFYAATLGTGWTERSGWDRSADPCSFYGVECDASGRVNKVDLTDNGLKGTVPTSIFKLPQLNELTLSNNAVSISFEGIFEAASLSILQLGGNTIKSIDGLGQASNLTTLNLADNSLRGEVPYELYLLTHLRELNLGFNQLTGRIPNVLGALTSLEILRLYHNRFTGRLPAALGDLSGLRELNLAENNFEGTIPRELNDLSNLRFLSLQREGGISGTDDIGIHHGGNRDLGTGLTGTIPAFDRLPLLSELYLGFNSLTGPIPGNFLDGVTDTSALVKVDLTSNQLTGTIPGSLTQFDEMNLYVTANRITGIANALCSKSRWMNGNVGSYSCDAFLCPDGTYNSLGRRSPNATTCETCPTGSDGFMGSIECFSSAQRQENAERVVLEKMFRTMNGRNWLFRTNWMDPNKSICNWYGIECQSPDNPTVVSIILPNNRLLDDFVTDIFSLPNLRKLVLKRNDINVSMMDIENAGKLEYLDLAETGLTSLAGVSSAVSLKLLRAEGNLLPVFPDDVFSLTNLETLDLSDNRFSQLVVPNLDMMPNLTYLGLQNCGLIGIIPPWVGQMTGLEYVKLGQNSLMGFIPTALNQLSFLRYLDLSDQASHGGGLEGPLLDFANQTQLTEIFLQHNYLTGTIPTTVLESFSGSDLVTLDLRFNHLDGTIPTELTHIRNMNLLLASNRFSSIPDAVCNTNWNGGNTGTHGCDAILCGRGTFNAFGRAIGDLGCMDCDDFMTAELGSTTCGSSLEHTSLIALYRSTGGPNWKSDKNWLRADDHCTWEGITCHERGEYEGLVQRIELPSNNLVGPGSLALIWRFEGLEYLNLQRNEISVFFQEIENAINLKTVILSGTKTDSLFGIGLAQQLRELHLTNSALFGEMPEELFDLSNLEKLYLSQNAFTGSLPSEIGRLTKLRDFYAFDNNLRGTLPSEIGLLGDMEHLSLGKNNFVGTIPVQINSLPKLELLSLGKEEDSEPSGMFSVGGGGFAGTLPSLSGLPNMKELYLGHNSLTGTIPSDFLQGVANKNDLLIVDLSYNNLSGPIPSSFSNFGNLQLELGRNQISDIPADICRMTSWFNGEVANGCDAILCFPGYFNEFGRRIDSKTICQPCTYPGSAIDYGAVSCGPVKAHLMSDQEILMELYDASGGMDWSNSEGWNDPSTSFCDWHGVRCEPVGGLGQMAVTEISLMENNLNGIVPSILFHLPELRKLDLRDNSVSIGLNAIFRAENLEELYLDKTRVTSLNGIGRATSLRVLHLHRNSFGWEPIPDEIFDLINLEDLNLSDSMFAGTLSTKIGNLANVKRLSLVGNALSGQIPSEIGNLASVQELHLSNNNWHGTLPAEIGGLESIVTFGLNNDNPGRVGVSGQLHPFDSMPALRKLYLAENQFTGTIPSNFLRGVADKSGLVTVNLNGNHLGGTIPASLIEFSKMNIYLENNLLVGFGEGVCDQPDWMDGNVGRFGCDAILCPGGEFSPAGRQTSEITACRPCPDLQNSPTLGSKFCLSIQLEKEREILSNLYQATNGANWRNNDGWLDDTVDICSWFGIKCGQGSGVESILLGSNGLVGTIPTSIYEMENLKFLWLYSNHIDLSFEGISQATSLTSLLLDATRIRTLQGIGNAFSLIDVDVRFNNLEGPIPSELSKLSNLQSFTCSQNSFTGTVPELTGLRQLTTLRMGSNKLTGTLPSFSLHPTLSTLDLSGNSILGPVPNNFLNAVPDSEEIFLDLSNNRLAGTIPGELARFPKMTIFLRNNNIEGINPNLCEQAQWNNGDVGTFECDGILCPKGTFSANGRASDRGECKSCSVNQFLGLSTCGGSSDARRAVGSLGFLLSTVIATTGFLSWA